MDLINYSNAEIWRLLLPTSQILFSKQTPRDELIFSFRNWVLFVHGDGSTLRIPKPKKITDLNYNQLWDLLFVSDEMVDYDDEGVFDLGEIMIDIGFVIPCYKKREQSYLIEIVRHTSPNTPVVTIDYREVNFQFAVYHGILTCTELYQRSGKEEEYIVRRIIEENVRETASHV